MPTPDVSTTADSTTAGSTTADSPTADSTAAVVAAGPSADPPDALRATARVTGLLYLGLAVTGLFGFLVVRNLIYVAGDPVETLRRLVEQESLARVGLALEFGVVITQALTAVWFYRLFRHVDTFAAGCIAAFGLVNAVVVLIAAGVAATAIGVATDSPAGAAGGGGPDPASTVHLLYQVSTDLWGVATIFFGLWLIPMGWCVLRTGTMPGALGRLLVIGGVGYVLSSFVAYLVPEATWAPTVLALPASVGEFWILGYLIVRGLGTRRPAPNRDHQGRTRHVLT